MQQLQRYLDRHKVLRGSLTFAILFSLFWLTGWNRLDPDFGWHLEAGNFIRAHGIPTHDIFTYTARSFHWIDHEWGNDVILSIVYGFGGYGLAAALYALLWTSGLLIVARARFLVLIIAVLAMSPYAGIRPIAWTVFFLAITLTTLQNNRRWLGWWLIPMFAVWANLHAGFIVGLGTIAYFALRKRNRRLAYLFILCLLATFINAYGPRLYVEIARTLFDPALHYEIEEWAPLTIPTSSWLFFVIWQVGFWLFDWRYWKRWLSISFLLLLATLSATRNMPLFVIAALQEADNYVSHITQIIPKKLDRPRRIVLALMALTLTGVFLYSLYSAYWPIEQNREAPYPTQAVAYLKVHSCPGNLFNSYDFGGFLIWKLPSQPVYIDGRMPSWEPYMNNYEAIINTPGKHYAQQFKQYDIRCALIEEQPVNAKIIKTLERAHWETVLHVPNSILLFAPHT